MNMQEFVDNHREKLIEHIECYLPEDYKIDDDEIKEWVINDEGLYNFAKYVEGVEDL